MHASSLYGLPKVGTERDYELITTSVSWSIESPLISQVEPVVDWWKQFGDPQLVKYIEESIQFNYDLQIAIARIKEAKALRGGAAANLYPKIDAYSRFTNTRFSDNGANPIGQIAEKNKTLPPNQRLFNIGNPTNVWDLGFDAAWEVDFFGRDRWNIERANEAIEETKEYRNAVVISLIAEVARNYIELRGTQNQLVNLLEIIETQEQTIKLLSDSYEIGIGTELDIITARAKLESLQANIPELEASIKSSAYRIAVLTGRHPDALLEDLLPLKPVPLPPAILGTGVPAELVTRRPDIRKIYRNLNAKTAEIGSARAELYPRIGIRGGFGFESLKIENIFKISSRKWNVNPYINWRVFERKSIKAQILAAKARQYAVSAELNQAVLNALQEVETSIDRVAAAKNKKTALERALQSTHKTYTMTTTSFDIGLNTYLDVLKTKEEYISQRSDLIKTETQTALETISLYKALGGGWQPFQIGQ
jgi:multidrug efflux system outer membrane protein